MLAATAEASQAESAGGRISEGQGVGCGPRPRLEPLAVIPPEISERPSQLSESGWSGPSVHVKITQSNSFYDPEASGTQAPSICPRLSSTITASENDLGVAWAPKLLPFSEA